MCLCLPNDTTLLLFRILECSLSWLGCVISFHVPLSDAVLVLYVPGSVFASTLYVFVLLSWEEGKINEIFVLYREIKCA